jgi:hypothetical protein
MLVPASKASAGRNLALEGPVEFPAGRRDEGGLSWPQQMPEATTPSAVVGLIEQRERARDRHRTWPPRYRRIAARSAAASRTRRTSLGCSVRQFPPATAPSARRKPGDNRDYAPSRGGSLRCLFSPGKAATARRRPRTKFRQRPKESSALPKPGLDIALSMPPGPVTGPSPSRPVAEKA